MQQNRWLDNLLGLCFCHALPEGREGGRHRCERPEARRSREDIDAYLASDLDFPDDMAEAFWLADTRSRRRAQGVSRLALRPS